MEIETELGKLEASGGAVVLELALVGFGGACSRTGFSVKLHERAVHARLRPNLAPQTSSSMSGNARQEAHHVVLQLASQYST